MQRNTIEHHAIFVTEAEKLREQFFNSLRKVIGLRIPTTEDISHKWNKIDHIAQEVTKFSKLREFALLLSDKAFGPDKN